MTGQNHYIHLTDFQPYQRQSAPTGATEPENQEGADRPLGGAACSALPVPNLPWVSDEWIEVRQPSGHPPSYYRVAAIESIRMAWEDGGMVHYVKMGSGDSFLIGSECGHNLMMRVCASRRTSHGCLPQTLQEQGLAAPSGPLQESDEPPSHSLKTRRTGQGQSQQNPLSRNPLSVLSI
jgi:hypothetical protein